MVGISSNGNIGMCHHLFFLYDNNFNEMWMNMDSYKFKNKDMKYVIEKYLPHIDNYNDIIRFFIQYEHIMIILDSKLITHR